MPIGKTNSPLEVFITFFKLGLTSFGGPVAHLGYFRDEFVNRKRWLDERSYADLVAMCQFLPGPASSQVGMGLGMMRCGYAGAAAAWVGFTLPSAVAMILFAMGVARLDLAAQGGCSLGNGKKPLPGPQPGHGGDFDRNLGGGVADGVGTGHRHTGWSRIRLEIYQGRGRTS